MNRMPLCVDCDGTLIRTDLLHEAMFLLLKQSPLSLLLVPFWLLRGKANLKQKIAERVGIDAASLPYHAAFLTYLRQQKKAGRQLVLATASARPYADAVARHLNLFDAVHASEDGVNLSSRRKAERLEQLFGARGFVYAGNAKPDLQVWQRAAGAILVDTPDGVKRQARKLCAIDREFNSPRPGMITYLKAMRLHQWLKNALVFVPLLTAHRFTEIDLLVQAGLAFLAYGLCASSVYLLNDLLDLSADRAHPRKRQRPFASGDLPLLHGVILIPVLLLGALAIAAFLPIEFALVLAAYYLTTLAYSLWLKNRVMVDVILLAALYTFRIIAGAAATGIAPSFWLLAFSMFVFLSLAMVKRYAELHSVLKEHKTSAAGRGYHVDDLPLLASMGSASGYLSILVMALFVNSADVHKLYAQPTLLWLVLPLLLFWVSRIWMKTHRGEMHDDPVVFAARDRTSLIVAVLVALVFAAASGGWLKL